MRHRTSQARPGDTSYGEYVDLIRQPDNSLVVALTDEGREVFPEIEGIRHEHGIDGALHQLLADHFANGWHELRPEELGALTSALLISDDVVRDDEGHVTDCGCIYWNPSYQVMDEIAELRQNGRVVFTGVD